MMELSFDDFLFLLICLQFYYAPPIPLVEKIFQNQIEASQQIFQVIPYNNLLCIQE